MWWRHSSRFNQNRSMQRKCIGHKNRPPSILILLRQSPIASSMALGGAKSRGGGSSSSRRSTTTSYASTLIFLTLCIIGVWMLSSSNTLVPASSAWRARQAVVYCAAVCKSWRDITKEVVRTPEECGRITFPISLKQPGPHELPIQCYIRRDQETSTYFLHIGLTPSEFQSDKLLPPARKIRRATCTEFVISLSSDTFSRRSNTYVGKLRSNFLGTKFTIYDGQLPCGTKVNLGDYSSQRVQSKRGSSKVSAQNYKVGTITYELNILRSRGPRRLRCVMHAIPMSSIEKGGTAPTPTSFNNSYSNPIYPSASKADDSAIDFSSTSLANSIVPINDSDGPLMLKNKQPRWHEQLQCWCLNFRGRVTVASVKNFQLVAAVESSENVSAEEQERVILQFGKIGKGIFTMDYSYPLSAFQAFAICLTSFDNKPACE